MINIHEQIISDIINYKPKTKAEFDEARRRICGKLFMPQPPNQELLIAYQKLLKKKSIKPDKTIEFFLRKATIRSLSGIAIVTSLVKPYPCPGKCIYCPTEIRLPKSYIATEPAAARALRLDFSPYEQMRQRILMLERNGHPTDKIEYIIKGGTWNAYPLKYQYWFILESFKACNNFMRRCPKTSITIEQYNNLTIERLVSELNIEQNYNESARHRIIGLTLETRPDVISPKTIYHMRCQGCTRIELGLQAPDDEILKLINRGHTVQQFRDAMFMLRQAGCKVDLHFMPDLPGTTPKHDVEMYQRLFTDPGLKPDMVKIYPNVIVKSAELYQWFLDGRHKPYGGASTMFKSLLQMKLATPRYCRISRLIRDIPATEIKGGNTVTNLREMLSAGLAEQGKRCVCLHCREVSRQKKYLPKNAKPQLFVEEYETIGGREYFLSFEDKNRIAVYGFLRLRIPNLDNPTNLLRYLPEIKACALIRELHIYGQLVGIGKKNEIATQHKGLGKKLMQAAEKIAKEKGFKKVVIISGVGVRGYYRKIQYRKVGTYMVKKI